ncbi:MAG: 2-methylaconitate cis-trans isomerase PrpF family protein [Acetobacteraceae bacterium]
MDALRCTIMRGGTSKAVFLREEDLPPPGAERDRIILKVFGSPDKRQIDGLGGADPLTSKLAIIGRPRVADTDVTYTFGQVEIDRPHVDYHSLCGNISSAVGQYAIEEGLVTPQEGITRVRVYTTNLKRILSIEVPVQDGKPVRLGSYRVPGVPGSGARILLDFAETAGGATGALLPTGNPVDTLEVPGVGAIEASLVDIGNAHVFIRARDVGLRGTESPAEIDRDKALLDRLELIRGAGAHRMGMASAAKAARAETPATPILGIVSPPAAYTGHLDGAAVAADDVDLVSRLLFMQITHKTYAGTSTACTGVAARIPGTLVHEALRPAARERIEIRIGHPAGVIDTESEVVLAGAGRNLGVRRATLGRTARRILDGTVYLEDLA